MKLRINPRLITDIIGKGQYTQFKSIMAEYVANAFDAEATKVELFIPDDFTADPIVIQDNGTGIRDIATFEEIGANAQLRYSITPQFGRKVMAKKGIGRFSGFSIAQQIIYSSFNSGNRLEITFDRDVFSSHGDLDELDIPSTLSPDAFGSGTTVTLNIIDQQTTIPSVNQVKRDLLTDFGISADFELFVNGDKCIHDDIIGEFVEINESIPEIGKIEGSITLAKSKSKKIDAGVIIRVRNRRVEGPTLFGLEEELPQGVASRLYGEIHVDSLEEIITSGREAFIQHDQRYIKLIDFIKLKLLDIATRVEAQSVTDISDYIFNLPRFKARYIELPDHLQHTCREYIKSIGPKLARIKHDRDMIELIGILIVRACENADFYAVLYALENTENPDIATLAKVLQRWSFGEVAYSSHLIQARQEMLRHFSTLVNDKQTLELQGVHKILESSTWILDDRYTLFTSNQSLKKIVEKIGSDFQGKNGNKRPDLIVKRDRDDFVIIELKAPRVTVTAHEVIQALEYKTLLQNHFPEMRDCDVYLVGNSFDQTAKTSFGAGNPQRVRLQSLQTILQNADDRLKWLFDHLRDEYDSLSKSIDPNSFVPDSHLFQQILG